MSIETGDIVEFEDMPVNPFSETWTDLFFMVTKVVRTVSQRISLSWVKLSTFNQFGVIFARIE